MQYKFYHYAAWNKGERLDSVLRASDRVRLRLEIDQCQNSLKALTKSPHLKNKDLETQPQLMRKQNSTVLQYD